MVESLISMLIIVTTTAMLTAAIASVLRSYASAEKAASFLDTTVSTQSGDVGAWTVELVGLDTNFAQVTLMQEKEGLYYYVYSGS